MFNSAILNYTHANDYLQTRVRHPRKIMPNFALLCDWIIWDSQYTCLDHSKKPQTIYVRSDIECLNYYIDHILPEINTSYILITSSHDTPMPLGFGDKFGLDWLKIVENKFVTYWVTENRDLLHPKIKPLPLGLPHPDLPSWLEPVNEKTVWSEALFKGCRQWIAKPKLQKIFGCWYPRVGHPSRTCPVGNDERQLAYEHFIDKQDLFDWYKPGMSRHDFLRKLGEYQFILCPHGGGLDPNPKCWESLIMQAIPILRKNTMSEALAHLPVVIVDEWDQVSKTNLEKWRRQYCGDLANSNLKYLMSNTYYFKKILGYLEN